MVSGTNNTLYRHSDPFENKKFNNLFNEFYSPLCRFSMKFVMDKNAAEDIVQDLFLYLWENWEKMADIASIKSYAYTAVKNRSLSYLKKQFVGEITENAEYTKESVTDGVLRSPQELIECKELEAILEKALESLPLKCRAIFTMKRFGELSNKEVAENLQISVKTVEAQMTIAIRKLTSFISDHWELILLILINPLHFLS